VGTDVTASNGTSIVLTSASNVGDEVNIYAFATFNVANTYTQAESDARFFNVTGDSISGNLTFTGTGNRILGDFSNATLSNRVIFKTSTTNGNTALEAIPNGTSNTAIINVSNNSSDLANTSILNLFIDSTSARLQSGIRGTGTYLPLTMFTGGSERLRIDTSGNLLVGTTSPTINNSNSFIAFPDSVGGVTVTNHANGSASGSVYAYYGYNGSAIGGVTQNGTTGVSYVTTSDYRLKENVAPMIGALDKVTQLKPVTYTWKADGSSGQGFIAHELQAVVPECVTGKKDAVDEDGNIKPQGIDTSFLVATLTAAIQELKSDLDSTKTLLANAISTVDEQAARIATLEGAV
jgi:hypothetical protein